MFRRIITSLSLFLAITGACYSQCNGTITVTEGPQPDSGNTYSPGQIVEFCFTMVGYSQTNANWFHGLTLSFGAGWDTSTLTVVSEAASGDGNGVWNYYQQGDTSTNTGQIFGSGFYYNSTSDDPCTCLDGSPGNNFGDDCGTCTWTFCFTIQVWDTASPGASLSMTGLVTGDGYSGSWSDNTGCGDLATTMSTSTVGNIQFLVNMSSTGVACTGGCTASASASAINGVGPYTYLWNTGQTDSTLTGLCPNTTYTVTATSSTLTTASGTITIAPPDSLSVNVEFSENTCGTSCTGYIEVQVSGGTAPFSYNWGLGGGDTTADVFDLCSGVYVLTVTDAGGCSGTLTDTITSGLNIIILSQTNVGCSGLGSGSITITTNFPQDSIDQEYFWSDGTSEFGTSTASDGGLAAGTYYVTVDDFDQGCYPVDTFTITQSGSLVLNPATTVNVSCTTLGSLSANPSGGTPPYTYSWIETSNGQTFTTQMISGLSAGTYDLTVSDNGGCTDTAIYQIAAGVALTFTTDSTAVSCFGGNDGTAGVTVTNGTPPYQYNWNNTGNGSNANFTGLSAGTVTVIVSDANCTDTATIQITQPTQLVLNLVSQTNVLCAGGSTGAVSVSATGGTGAYNFTWSNGQTGTTASNLSAGAITVTVTDANNCSATLTETITEPAALAFNPPTIQNIGCSGGNVGSITANVTGGITAYTYSWVEQSNSQTFTGQTISNLGPDTYAITVTDANGCTISSSYQVTASAVLLFTQSSVAVLCFGGNNGSASVQITSGSPPYQFNWDNTGNGTDSTLSNLSAGQYTVAISDASGCTGSATITVSQPAQLSTSLVSLTNSSCSNTSNGTITVTASGGTPGYAYAWSNGQSGPTISGLDAGTYFYTVTDGNGCTANASDSIIEPSAIVTNPVVSNDKCFLSTDGFINSNPSGGTPPYSYLWSDGQTTLNAVNLAIGMYQCTVTDASGCTAWLSASVTQPAQLTISDSAVQVQCIGQMSGSIWVNGTGGFTPYTFSATKDGQNFSYSTNGVILGLDTGTYTITLTDSNNCVQTATAYVPNATPDIFTATTDSAYCYGYDDGSAEIISTSLQNGPYQYSVDGGLQQFSGNFGDLSAGEHTLYAVNIHGCLDSVPIVILQPLPIVVSITPDSITMPLGGTQGVQVQYLNATNPAFNWTPAFGLSCMDCPNPVVNTYVSGEYTVTVSQERYTATCYGSATLLVNITPLTPYFIPTAFSPNGDGNNDYFRIYGENIKSVDIKVFDRWGELVYSTNNMLNGWDGTYKGKPAPQGEFTYETIITFLDDTQVQKNGSIMLMR